MVIMCINSKLHANKKVSVKFSFQSFDVKENLSHSHNLLDIRVKHCCKSSFSIGSVFHTSDFYKVLHDYHMKVSRQTICKEAT